MSQIPSKKYESKQWEKRWETYSKLDFIKHDKLLNNILLLFNGELKGIKILEVGAGSGIDTIHLAKKNANSYALDYSTNSIKTIKKLSKENNVKIDIIKATIERIPFIDKSFDLVFSQGVIEHYKNPKKLILEQIRILKNGGFLIIDVPQKYSLYMLKKKILKFFNRWVRIEKEYALKDLKEIEKKFNLKLVKIYGWGFYPYKLWNIYFPSILGNHYKSLYRKIENSKFFPNMSQCIGAVYQKYTNDK